MMRHQANPSDLFAGDQPAGIAAGEGCPWELEPLIELMFRGTPWLQRNGRDWTLAAFLGSADALNLDLAADQTTKAALSRASPNWPPCP